MIPSNKANNVLSFRRLHVKRLFHPPFHFTHFTYFRQQSHPKNIKIDRVQSSSVEDFHVQHTTEEKDSEYTRPDSVHSDFGAL